MDAAQLRALSKADLCILCDDCGLVPAADTASSRDAMVEQILVWQRRQASLGSSNGVHPADLAKAAARVLRLATPARARRRKPPSQVSCGECGWSAVVGVCACNFLHIDPLRPVAEVLGLATIAANTPALPRYGCISLRLQCSSLLRGESIELRMVSTSDVSHHVWPHALEVRVDASEAFCVQPPREGMRRSDAPQDLTPYIPSHGADVSFCMEVKADGGSRHVTEFVLCVVRAAPRVRIVDLVADCLTRPRISGMHTQTLWSSLRSAEEDVSGLECISLWMQPLLCPLTRERLVVPARGCRCRHIQCFDLEAYLVTSARATFQQRWRCPICDCPLPPSELAVCEVTTQLLKQEGPEVTASPLDPLLKAAGEIGGFGMHANYLGTCAAEKKMARRRWRQGTLRTAGVAEVMGAGGARKTPSIATWGRKLGAAARGGARCAEPMDLALD